MTHGLDVLRLIQDVDWVVGSFIADPSGELLIYQMPPHLLAWQGGFQVTHGLDVLRLIQDVDWVVGSFIADPSGELLIYQMPPEFGEEALRRTASRVASIVRSGELCGVEVDQCDFSLSRYQLVMNRSAAGMVCVLVEAPVSRRALSMATRIALAELPRLIVSLESGVLVNESGRPADDLRRLALPEERFGPIASVTPPE